MRNLSDSGTIPLTITFVTDIFVVKDISVNFTNVKKKKQHKQLCVSLWALSHTLTNHSIKKLSKTANATETKLLSPMARF